MLASLFKLQERGLKTLIKNDRIIHHEETWENPKGGHVPKHSKYPFAKTILGEEIVNNYATIMSEEEEKVRLLHCRYRGLSDFNKKINSQVTISDKENYQIYKKFTQVLNIFRLK